MRQALKSMSSSQANAQRPKMLDWDSPVASSSGWTSFWGGRGESKAVTSKADDILVAVEPAPEVAVATSKEIA